MGSQTQGKDMGNEQGHVVGGENALLSGLTYRPSDSKKCGLVTKVPLQQGSNCQWLVMLRVAELVSHLHVPLLPHHQDSPRLNVTNAQRKIYF